MITNEQKQTYKALLKEQNALIKKFKKKGKRRFRFYILIGVILGIILGITGKRLEDKGFIEPDSFNTYLFFGFFLYFIFIFTHIIIHETGHLVFGLISGYSFKSFRIFSLTFIKTGDRIQRKKYSVKGTAGQCLMSPPKRNEDGSFPFVLYNLGGGLANLIVSLPFLAALMLTDNVIVSTIFISFATSGIMIAATNLIPMDLGVQNDGMNVKGMLKHKYLRDSFYLQLKVYDEMSNGKLITEYDPGVFAMPEDADIRYSLTAFNIMYKYYRYLAVHDFESAYEYLEKMLEKKNKYPIGTLNSLQAEQLFFMVLHHRPVQEIASLYKRMRIILNVSKTDISVQRIRYIYEALLSEEEKMDIMTLILNARPRKWKKCNLKKLRQDIERVAASYPVAGEAALHMDIIEYCSRLNMEQENNIHTKQDNNEDYTEQGRINNKDQESNMSYPVKGNSKNNKEPDDSNNSTETH